MLRTHRDRWDMSFAEGGAAALATLHTKPCDVIISDFRMPGMDGAELLERVRDEYPGTARVILSGQTNEENLLRIIVLAHQFLTKPSTPEQIVETVERLIGVHATSTDEETRRDVTAIESLPSAPNTLIELVEALESDVGSAQSVGAVIERDPAAAAKVLHLVNSSAYSLGRQVSSVGQAVALLGMNTVRGLVLMHDLIRTFDVAGHLPAEWIHGLTLHSVETSRLARQLAADAAWESHAFMAGLLHEVGQLVLASSRPAAYRDVLATWRAVRDDTGESVMSEDGTLDVAELAAFEVCHGDVGADLLGLWGLPVPVVEAVSGHAAGTAITAATDASSAVALAHLMVEAELGPVCGRYDDTSPLDEDQLDEAARAAITRWRRELSRQRR
jgi:HD-like signal output (HDOD) protein/CheY-like chemotaxis protein